MRDAPRGVVFTFFMLTGTHIDGFILFAFQRVNETTPTNIVEALDTVTLKWDTSLPPLPGPARRSAASATHGATIYIAGGYNEDLPPNGVALSLIQAFDTIAGTWNKKNIPNMLYPFSPYGSDYDENARTVGNIAIAHNYLYAFGFTSETELPSGLYDTTACAALDLTDMEE